MILNCSSFVWVHWHVCVNWPARLGPEAQALGEKLSILMDNALTSAVREGVVIPWNLTVRVHSHSHWHTLALALSCELPAVGRCHCAVCARALLCR